MTRPLVLRRHVLAHVEHRAYVRGLAAGGALGVLSALVGLGLFLLLWRLG